MLSSRKISKFKSKNSNPPFFGRILSGKQITLFSCPSVLKKAGTWLCTYKFDIHIHRYRAFRAITILNPEKFAAL